MDRAKIGKTQIAALGLNQTVWDTSVVGFGARRQRGAAVTYFLMYRDGNGVQRRFTIGRHGPLTPDQARDKAKAFQGQIVGGVSPAAKKASDKAAPTISQLCDAYMRDATEGRLLTRRRTSKKASTLSIDAGRIERHIKPLLGDRKAAAISKNDTEAFMHDVANGKTATWEKTKTGFSKVTGGKGTATRTMGLLGAIFTYAVRKGVRVDNPVTGVVKFAENRRERRISDAEYPKLGQALLTCEQGGLWPPAIAAARFLLLTGWRRGEALNLQWSEVDRDRRTATLADTKTGRSIRPLSVVACELLEKAPKTSTYVFAAARKSGAMNGFPGFWIKILAAGNLPADITPHVLRHSYASLASDLGYSESTIAALIGHARHSMTSRYVHSADAVLLAAADAIASEILRRMKVVGQ